jgi:non-specific serine/threonine protein kinase/serine/threonine-protein kinase
MNARRLDDFRGLPPTQAWRVDAVCQRFEAEWRAEREPRIEDFLPQADQPQRVALLRELLALELELRRNRGERPDPREYRSRFPGHTAAIEAVSGLKSAASSDAALTSTVVPAEPPLTEVTEFQIGPYKRLRKIGEGGMGIVYRAEQETPIRREVALKIIKPGMDSDQVIARFEAERQALALMDHPHIAKVLDAGVTDTGRHYFVMELIHGIPITDYCDQNQLTPDERLELFIRVCQTVQHAHQKGIIHRDIKPSNVLVTLHDGRPVPKVIDFGLAKAIDQRLTERTLFTQFGEVVGTLEYMSPEQAELGALDIDTRGDIYSLGVVLYELLTGSTPLGRVRLRETTYAEILRRIREEEAPKPSSRLSESGEALATIAARRKTEPARLAKLVRGELDWIVMRAVEKDRTRRYESAGGLARDIERYLEGEVVEAGPPSARYKLSKFARRHRTALATAGLFALLLIGGAAVSMYSAIRARQAEAETKRALAEAEDAQAKTDQALKESEGSRSQAEAVSRFLVETFRKPDPARDGSKVTVAEVLDQAVSKLQGQFAGSPRIEGELLQALGETYNGLGLYDKAVKAYELAVSVRSSSLGPDHPDTLASRNVLAKALVLVGRTADAIPLFERALKLHEAKLGRYHPDTLTSRSELAEACGVSGRAAEATRMHEQTLELCEANLGHDHPLTKQLTRNLMQIYYNASEFEKALPYYLEMYQSFLNKEGAQAIGAVLAMRDLAEVYSRLKRYGEAEPLFLRALEFLEGRPKDDPIVVLTKSYLANMYAAQKRYHKAEPLLTENLEISRRKFSQSHPEVARRLAHLGQNRLMQRKYAAAEPLLRECLAIRAANLPDMWITFDARSQLGGSLLGQGKYAEAEPLVLTGYEGMQAREAWIAGLDKNRLVEAGARIVALYDAWGKPGAAEAWRAKLHLPPDELPAVAFAL